MSFDPRRFAGVVVGLLLLAAGCSPPLEPDSLEELARRSLAQISGELDVPGLRESVEVIRDEWGIPHIYAQNDDDLFLAQGYVMAQDRLWQMEMWRRWHEGRLSEIFGPEAFNYDLRTRQMMFRGPWDESRMDELPPRRGAHLHGLRQRGQRIYRAAPRQPAGRVPAHWSRAGSVDCQDRGAALGAGRAVECPGPCDQ